MNYTDIQGWFCAERLYLEAAQRVPAGGALVEIGAFMGRSACYMAQTLRGMKKDVSFFTVDHFLGSDGLESMMEELSVYETFQRNMEKAGVSDFVKLLKMDSISAAKKFSDESLDFLFIDGAHDYESVKADLCAWGPKMKRGGLIGGDDYNERGFPGVRRAVDEFFGPRKVMVFFERVWYIETEGVPA